MHPNAFRVLPALVNLHTEIEKDCSVSSIFRKTLNYEQKFILDSGNRKGGDESDIKVEIDGDEEYQVKEIKDSEQLYYVLENNFGQLKQNNAVYQAQTEFKRVLDNVLEIANLRTRVLLNLDK